MSHSRRNFLKYSTLAGLGISINPLSSFLPAEKAGITTTSKSSLIPKAGQQLVTVLQTTDVHCQLHPHDELFWENNKSVFRTTGGYAYLATLFEQIRKENPNTFLIDTGDMFQGSLLAGETRGKALQPILNALGYNLYLPGNWEVVYYKAQMQKLLGGLNAPKVCANMYHDIEGKKGELIFPAYYTWSIAGVKIGFIGYTDPLVPVRQSPAYSKGIIYTKPEENLPYYVKLLREQEQCNMVIILSHLGLSQQIALANAEECQGVDYILGGDTHERVRTPIQCKYAKVVEPGAFGSFVGRLDLLVENGEIIKEQYSLLEVNPEKLERHTSIHDILKKAEEPYKAMMDQVVGYSKIPLYRYFVVENTIDTLVIKALKWKIGTDIVLSNGFRFCPPKSKPDSTGNIPITEGYLYDMLPIDSVIRVGKTTGKEIKEWFEKELNNVFAKEASKRLGGWLVKFKGMKIEFKAFEEYGQRIKSITVDGKPIDLNKMYSICACEREGDPLNMLCRMENVKDVYNSPFHLHEAVKQYLMQFSPVSPKPELNAVILDAPQNLLTQVTGVDYNFI